MRKGYIDRETGLGNFGARAYIAEEGRFGSVDPLWEKFRSQTPYNYSMNAPLALRDQDGQQGGRRIVTISRTAPVRTANPRMSRYVAYFNQQLARDAIAHARAPLNQQPRQQSLSGRTTIGRDGRTRGPTVYPPAPLMPQQQAANEIVRGMRNPYEGMERNSARPIALPSRFISGVTVVDRRTGRTLSGTVDLKPTLDRIASGQRVSHRNDGGVFRNRPLPGKTTPELPVRPSGYYREWVVPPPPGGSFPGPQRVVTGQNGETYYTPNHYQTFIPIK